MTPVFQFQPASLDDFDRLFALRLLTMRESLGRIGRFDSQRALQRFQSSFRPQHTNLIVVEGQLAGCVALGAQDDHLLLEHFYLAPEYQGHGLGTQVLKALLAQSNVQNKPVRLSVLQQSAAARFYERHRFTKTGEDEWDIYYQYLPQG